LIKKTTSPFCFFQKEKKLLNKSNSMKVYWFHHPTELCVYSSLSELEKEKSKLIYDKY
jgi:hypothetical protein